MRQQIVDRLCVAQTFVQLGIMLSKRSSIEKGLRLVAQGAMIFNSIGNAQLKAVEPWVNQLASQLQYIQEQFDSMLHEVQESYQRDRGWGLIEAAFADLPPKPDKV
jgi:hypothetical protein